MATKSNRKQSPPDAEVSAAESPESLEKVRDILFGSHMRSVEGRISRVEERLLREQQAARASLEAAIANLESFARKELEAIGEKLKAERVKRADDLKALAGETKEALRAVDKQLATLDEVTSVADADLRSEVLEQKRTLAALFADLAARLSQELKAPPAK